VGAPFQGAEKTRESQVAFKIAQALLLYFSKKMKQNVSLNGISGYTHLFKLALEAWCR